LKPNPNFLKQPKSFWACVRSLSEGIGYSKGAALIVPTIERMAATFSKLDLDPRNILEQGHPTVLGRLLHEYFQYRADVLHQHVEPYLMDAAAARELFLDCRNRYNPRCPLPMNKQKEEKRAEAYLTCIVNMIIEAEAQGFPCDYDPRQLTTVTRNGAPVRTLARRVDGAFPNIVNPVAIWEIKEYYYTTTFGSRVADGVYESLLDGLELEELREHEGIDVKHYLMVDAYRTWWKDGKSYLCRIVDMLHMGYVDEVLFGKEVVSELPRIVREWVKLAEAAGKTTASDAELF
jgi:hypothetical protein